MTRELLITMLRTTATKPCECGGHVRADRREPTAGVAAHNRSNLHRAWRAQLVEPSFDVRVKTR